MGEVSQGLEALFMVETQPLVGLEVLQEHQMDLEAVQELKLALEVDQMEEDQSQEMDLEVALEQEPLEDLRLVEIQVLEELVQLLEDQALQMDLEVDLAPKLEVSMETQYLLEVELTWAVLKWVEKLLLEFWALEDVPRVANNSRDRE